MYVTINGEHTNDVGEYCDSEKSKCHTGPMSHTRFAVVPPNALVPGVAHVVGLMLFIPYVPFIAPPLVTVAFSTFGVGSRAQHDVSVDGTIFPEDDDF